MDNTVTFSQPNNGLPSQPASGFPPPSNPVSGIRGSSTGLSHNVHANPGAGCLGPAIDFEARRNDAAPFEQSAHITADLLFIHSGGVSDSIETSSFGGKLPSLQNFVGTEAFGSALYKKRPIQGVCGFSVGTGLRLVPIESKGQDWKASLLAKPGEYLHGLRFAFDGKRGVGFQGLIKSGAEEKPAETEWFGAQNGRCERVDKPFARQNRMCLLRGR